MIFVRPMRKIKAHDIHASFDKLGKHFNGLGFGSNRADDFGLDLDMAAHGAQNKIGLRPWSR